MAPAALGSGWRKFQDRLSRQPLASEMDRLPQPLHLPLGVSQQAENQDDGRAPKIERGGLREAAPLLPQATAQDLLLAVAQAQTMPRPQATPHGPRPCGSGPMRWSSPARRRAHHHASASGHKVQVRPANKHICGKDRATLQPLHILVAGLRATRPQSPAPRSWCCLIQPAPSLSVRSLVDPPSALFEKECAAATATLLVGRCSAKRRKVVVLPQRHSERCGR